METGNDNQNYDKMRTVEEVKHQLLTAYIGGEAHKITDMMKTWAEEIMWETANYKWTETSWVEQQEQVRELKRKL